MEGVWLMVTFVGRRGATYIRRMALEGASMLARRSICRL
jgi:hypothetical protein